MLAPALVQAMCHAADARCVFFCIFIFNFVFFCCVWAYPHINTAPLMQADGDKCHAAVAHCVFLFLLDFTFFFCILYFLLLWTYPHINTAQALMQADADKCQAADAQCVLVFLYLKFLYSYFIIGILYLCFKHIRILTRLKHWCRRMEISVTQQMHIVSFCLCTAHISFHLPFSSTASW